MDHWRRGGRVLVRKMVDNMMLPLAKRFHRSLISQEPESGGIGMLCNESLPGLYEKRSEIGGGAPSGISSLGRVERGIEVVG